MLSCEAVAQLAVAIVATAETLGQTISASAAELMADDLAEYPVEAIKAALRACRRELTGRLTLAAILQRIHAEDGRPSRDEAWAIALQAEDERDTVVLTEEIMAAMLIARPVLATRDKVGARMTFLAAYDRLLLEARSAARPVEWRLSLGFDPELRKRAIEQARDLGRLPAPEAERMMLRISRDAPTPNGIAIAGLITGSVAAPDPQTRERLQAIRADLLTRKRRRSVQVRWDARCALRAEREKINQERARIDQFQSQKGTL